jgi:hypothetical protein
MVPAPWRPLLFALALSVAVHALCSFWLIAAFELPSVDISFEMPMDVELGMAQEVAMEAVPTPAEPAVEQAATTAKQSPSTPGEKDPATDKKDRADAGQAKDKPKQPAAQDAGAASKPDLAAQGSKLPPGAQIAVRVDMARIRTSPVSEDVRDLLTAIPDWQALLAGSGIDPIDQLDRLLIATPNLQREKVVIAGRYVGTREVVDSAVASLAQAHSIEAAWHEKNGVETARWANADDVERVIALVGPQHFTISRPEDLPRVLAIAASRKLAKSDVHPAEALLSMEEGEGLSLEVEGVEQFVKRGKRGVPLRLRLSATEIPGPKVRIDANLSFENAEKAGDGLRFWDELRERYAGNALVMMLGLSGPLRGAKLETDEAQLRVRVQLSVAQTRLILGYVRGLVAPAAPMPVAPSPSGTSAPTEAPPIIP